ncbi:hypothetical protein [Knoellia sp. LjRoot47]|uniref:hypothetical protein n=1 Tax=Knoellia sp. LjRoot47 TaxID=3342330 RepID=UPI003ECCE1D1
MPAPTEPNTIDPRVRTALDTAARAVLLAATTAALAIVYILHGRYVAPHVLSALDWMHRFDVGYVLWLGIAAVFAAGWLAATPTDPEADADASETGPDQPRPHLLRWVAAYVVGTPIGLVVSWPTTLAIAEPLDATAVCDNAVWVAGSLALFLFGPMLADHLSARDRVQV